MAGKQQSMAPCGRNGWDVDLERPTSFSRPCYLGCTQRDMLTKGSCSRDEWNHLFRLLNIMSFSIFSVSHFSWFDRKAERHVNMRGQEATSPMAKTKLTIQAKARPLNLVARSPWSEKKLFTEFWVSGQSGECRWTKWSGHSIWKQFANRFKVRSRIFSSESTRNCSNSRGKLVHGATPKTKWSESTF